MKQDIVDTLTIAQRFNRHHTISKNSKLTHLKEMDLRMSEIKYRKKKIKCQFGYSEINK